jgi:phosphatidylserine decarboxylase
MGVVFDECFEDPQSLNTVKKIFERKIRYWECRPIPEDPCMIVSPADARMIAGSFSETSGMFLKGKFFDYKELFGRDKQDWLRVFYRGDFLICRLTPEKYHYNHLPVDGKVVDIYEIPGDYHSCNPGAVVVEATPYSKNKRVVTVIDTDVPAGTKIGLVAMIEVVALMIGEIVQCYSEYRYDFPKSVERGMFLRKGFPKSLYRPGSSTTVIVFQKGLVTFADDVVRNMYMSGINSRFSIGFGMPLVETDVQVRSCVAYKKRG